MDDPNRTLFAAVVAVSTLNGVLSPYLLVVIGFAPVWMPLWLPADPSMLFYLGSLLVATTTLLLSGVPAALVEGAFPGTRRGRTPMIVWLVSAIVLSLPGALRAFLIFGGG